MPASSCRGMSALTAAVADASAEGVSRPRPEREMREPSAAPPACARRWRACEPYEWRQQNALGDFQRPSMTRVRREPSGARTTTSTVRELRATRSTR